MEGCSIAQHTLSIRSALQSAAVLHSLFVQRSVFVVLSEAPCRPARTEALRMYCENQALHKHAVKHCCIHSISVLLAGSDFAVSSSESRVLPSDFATVAKLMCLPVLRQRCQERGEVAGIHTQSLDLTFGGANCRACCVGRCHVICHACCAARLGTYAGTPGGEEVAARHRARAKPLRGQTAGQATSTLGLLKPPC